MFRCVEEMKKSDKWVLPALKVMREICCLYEPAGGAGARPHVTRQEVIDRLQTQHSLVILVTNSLTHYVDTVRTKQQGTVDHTDVTLIQLRPTFLVSSAIEDIGCCRCRTSFTMNDICIMV